MLKGLFVQVSASATSYIIVRIRTIASKAHTLSSNIPNAVVVLQDATTDKIEPVHRIDERLARGRVACEWTDAEFTAGDSQVESLAGR